MAQKVPVLIRMPQDHRDRLTDCARELGVTRNALIVALCALGWAELQNNPRLAAFACTIEDELIGEVAARA